MGEMHVKIARNGPYLVYGRVPLAIETIGTDADGESVTWEPGRSFQAGDRMRFVVAANPQRNRTAMERTNVSDSTARRRPRETRSQTGSR
jgi:hypothetical protein